MDENVSPSHIFNKDGKDLRALLEQHLLKSGFVLNNRYQIEKMLGQGGMGEVYKAIDLQTKKYVAIKRSKLANEAGRRRFKREFKFLNTIRHVNLIEAYEHIEHRDDMYMILEFIEGMSSVAKSLPGYIKSNFYGYGERC